MNVHCGHRRALTWPRLFIAIGIVTIPFLIPRELPYSTRRASQVDRGPISIFLIQFGSLILCLVRICFKEGVKPQAGRNSVWVGHRGVSERAGALSHFLPSNPFFRKLITAADRPLVRPESGCCGRSILSRAPLPASSPCWPDASARLREPIGNCSATRFQKQVSR